MEHQRIFAFIDSQNVNLSIKSLGWNLDFARFRKYLADKYSVGQAFVFIGYVHSNAALYRRLREAGYICVFKPTLIYGDGKTKGNCDAEMVLYAMTQYPNYDKAVIVTGDGDFYCLVNYLLEKNKLANIMIPNRYKYSALLKFKIFRPYLRFMNDLREKLSYIEKAL